MDKQKWSTKDIPDLTGKTIIVTGGNSGLGFESVKAFVNNGAKVVMASRSLEKAEKAKTEILRNNPGGSVELGALNLSDLSSVRRFANEFKSKHDRLDVLLNNAGIMMTPFGRTKDGFENQFGTNHLGHFALTGLLLELLKNSSRIVNVSSLAHKRGEIDFDNLLYDNGKSYAPMKAYRRSKLANLLFTYELQRRFASNEIKTIAVAAHPGVSITNLGKHLEDKLMYKLLLPISGFFTHSPASGALPQIRAAVDPDVRSGQYYGPDGRGEMKGDPVLVQSNKASHSLADARMLWEVSEQLTGVKFMFSK
ncbi:MAG: oxidoreductase [Cytophagales bacterium]|nr:oxidoreductase [Cytophagales bacterium]